MGFFKAYDMRGTFGKDFTADTVRAVGEALPGVVGAKKFLVGRDIRLTSRTVRDALVAGLLSAGAEVDDIGPATTPMVYFFTANGNCGASVQITASHNPAGDNGMKVSFGDAMPVGYANGIGELEKIAAARLASGRPVPPFADVPALFPAPEEPDAARLARYVEWMRERRNSGNCENSSRISSKDSTRRAPSRNSAWQPLDCGMSTSPGTANTARPCSVACAAVIKLPD